METRRWINHSLPQTLGNAVLLLYISGAFDFLFGAGFPLLFNLVIVGGKVAGGYGIANEQKWGYQVAVAAAVAPFVFRFIFYGLDAVFGINILSLMFEVVLVALLLHPDSRNHQRIWFS